MPIQTYWDNDAKTIIRYEMFGRWTTQEFWDAYETAREMINSVEHKVYFIQVSMDKQSIGHIPNGFVTHLRSIYRNAHPRAGRTIIIPKARGMIGEIWDRMITKAMPKIRDHFDFADSLEEARALLETSVEKIT
ncbi:MAG: hypothetical protein ABI690_04985 [Chloroflexota bacterium]